MSEDAKKAALERYNAPGMLCMHFDPLAFGAGWEAAMKFMSSPRMPAPSTGTPLPTAPTTGEPIPLVAFYTDGP